MPPPLAVHFALQILEALAAVHAVKDAAGATVMVEDLKPSNCMLGRGDRLCEMVLLDPATFL